MILIRHGPWILKDVRIICATLSVFIFVCLLIQLTSIRSEEKYEKQGAKHWQVPNVYEKYSIQRTSEKLKEKYPTLYLAKACKIDKSNLHDLLSLDPSQLGLDRIHTSLQKTMLTPCKDVKSFGGKYIVGCKIHDGHKYVCVNKLLEDIEQHRCLIYSFGINHDYTFETIVSELGCEVHAYDPTVDLSNKKINFNFYKIGVSHINSKRDKKLSDLMKANGHNNKHITMIKMDIEGGELLGLDAWLEEGSLDNVHQIALEYHLYGGGLERARQFLSTVQNLNKHQFRTISWEANSCFQNTNQHIKRGDYFNLAEIVWVRISNSYNVSEACGY